MHKRILIGLIAATVLAVSAYTIFVFSTRTTDDNANINSNENTAAAQTAPIVSGNVVVNKSITYRGSSFEFETALATPSYSGQSAGTGKQFILLFLKPFEEKLAADPMTWAGTEVKLTALDDSFVPYEVSIPTAVGQRGGYFSFIVPDAVKDFSLVFGTGTSAESFAFSV
jgi:hypothetical protein